MSLAVINIGSSHSGRLDAAELPGDALVCDDGLVSWVGPSSDVQPGDHDVVLDAGGAGVIPGLIDSHVHVTFGDYTPRQQTVGFLESYLHGGVTTSISASEVHVPGRPRDVAGVKALALAAQRCFAEYRPGGMTVIAGSVLLEPGLEAADFAELHAHGVRLAKAGFGAFQEPEEYAPLVHAAKRAGLVVMSHTGGGSIPGSMERIHAPALLEMQPHVAGHVNGGPTAMSDEDAVRLVREGTDIALQIATAGNLRSALLIAREARAIGAQDRLLIATDTPTGTGVMPLGMLHSMAELVSLGGMTADEAVAAATGNVARAYRLTAGRLDVGAPADLLVVDAPVGSYASDWRGALEIGDMPAVAAVVTAGVLRTTRSRNTPGAKRPATILDAVGHPR